MDMKENTFSEHDSLELIAQMICQSKKNMRVGSGNILLYYGYPALLISVAVYLLVHLTGKPIWSALWFLMFVPVIGIRVSKEKSEACVVTHMDKAINSIWSICGQLFFLTVIGITIFGYFTGCCNFTLMLPLSLLYCYNRYYYRFQIDGLYSINSFCRSHLYVSFYGFKYSSG